jgi:hypothetical protein
MLFIFVIIFVIIECVNIAKKQHVSIFIFEKNIALNVLNMRVNKWLKFYMKKHIEWRNEKK